jgi:hypothetical protein
MGTPLFVIRAVIFALSISEYTDKSRNGVHRHTASPALPFVPSTSLGHGHPSRYSTPHSGPVWLLVLIFMLQCLASVLYRCCIARHHSVRLDFDHGILKFTLPGTILLQHCD